MSDRPIPSPEFELWAAKQGLSLRKTLTGYQSDTTQAALAGWEGHAGNPRVPIHELPTGIQTYGLKLAEGTMVYGVPLHECSRVQLIALAAIGWKKYQEALHENGTVTFPIKYREKG